MLSERAADSNREGRDAHAAPAAPFRSTAHVRPGTQINREGTSSQISRGKSLTADPARRLALHDPGSPGSLSRHGRSSVIMFAGMITEHRRCPGDCRVTHDQAGCLPGARLVSAWPAKARPLRGSARFLRSGPGPVPAARDRRAGDRRVFWRRSMIAERSPSSAARPRAFSVVTRETSSRSTER